MASVNSVPASHDVPLILVAEDTPEQQLVLRTILTDLPCRVLTASSGGETLEVLTREIPDLILLDVIMPGMDGLEVLRRLKERSETCGIPVIILTAKGGADDVVRGLEAGALDYISKPFNDAELKARVKTHLKIKQMREQQQALITELQEALTAVKNLSGLIPICAHCKKIRNDLGYWQQVEEYIGGHSEAMFTHGLCPDCVPEFFPDLVREHPALLASRPVCEVEESLLPKILIVDDSPTNLRMLIQFLRLDYKILVATNGAVALELARKERPDLILLDVVMPEMDGREICRALRCDPRTSQVPVIFVTANRDEIDEMEGFELGAVDYVRKPFSLPVVHARIRTHVELKHYRDVLALQIMQDELTGLHNRKGFLEFLAIMWKQAIRERMTIAMVLFGIDDMKAFNEIYGRRAGDDCLRKVALALKSRKRRGTDLLARYGGQEFALLLPGTDVKGAVIVAEMMRKTMEMLAIPHSGSSISDHLTVSGGVIACRPELGNDPASLIEGASQALYRARQDGRNRVSL